MSHADFRPEDIDRLDKMMLIVAAIGLATNLVQIVAISNHAWLKATAMSNGQPFTAYLSLGSAKFGNSTHPSKDSKYFCNQRGECSLRYLCASPVSSDMYPNGMVFNTPQDAWCRAETAGSSATRFLFFGLLLGLGATGFTGLYAAQAIPCVADQFDKIEEMGFEDIHQKYIIFAGWTALWIFTFASMFSYALTIPDSLGWGDVELESSFGLLRVCFVLVSIQCALVANSVFDGPLDEALGEAVELFHATPWLSLKKVIYFELALQQIAYFFMIVDHLDWSAMLVVLPLVYIWTDHLSFFLIYLIFIVISALFDIILLAEMPAFGTMTQGEIFGSVVSIVVFAFKPIIAGTMIADYLLAPKERGDEEAPARMAYGANAPPYGRQDDDDDDEDVKA